MKTPLYLLMLIGLCLLAGACTAEDLAEDLQGDPAETSGTNPEVSDSPDDTQGPNDDASNPDGSSTEESGADDDTNDPPAEEESTSCSPVDYIFEEANGVVLAEFEASSWSDAWDKEGTGPSAYLLWEGDQYFGNPGNGVIRFSIRINNPGTYQFSWRSAVTIGTNGTEHNDTWLRFPDASDFYALKDNSVLYPAGSGKSPNPNGASADGWFKVYRTGNNVDFKWEAFTSDHDGHRIFVDFDQAGTYTMEISARSKGHGIDRFVLFRNDLNLDEAISGDLSAISCAN